MSFFQLCYILYTFKKYTFRIKVNSWGSVEYQLGFLWMSEALKDKKKKLEQQKARLALQEAKLKIIERKSRTRRLIELGGLIAKAKLDAFPNNVLYGMLLEAQTKSKDESQVKAWEKGGGAAFSLDQKEKVPVIITFESKPSVDARNIIRAHGLKWNSIRKEWHGLVESLKQLKEDVRPFEGKIMEIEN